MKKIMLPLLAGLVLLAACSKDTPDTIVNTNCNCDSLKQGILSNNTEQMQQEFNTLTADLLPQITTADEYGQQNNLYLLSQRIHRQCGIEASEYYYNTVETLPPQSEMIWKFSQNGQLYQVTADISYTPQYMLRLVGIHE